MGGERGRKGGRDGGSEQRKGGREIEGREGEEIEGERDVIITEWVQHISLLQGGISLSSYICGI